MAAVRELMPMDQSFAEGITNQLLSLVYFHEGYFSLQEFFSSWVSRPLMILKAPQMLTPELLGLHKPCFPYTPTWARWDADQLRPTPGPSDASSSQGLEHPGTLVIPKLPLPINPTPKQYRIFIPFSERWKDYKRPLGWRSPTPTWCGNAHPEDRGCYGELFFAGRIDVCRWCSVSDISNLDHSRPIEGSGIFIIMIIITITIIVTITMMRTRKKDVDED